MLVCLVPVEGPIPGLQKASYLLAVSCGAAGRTMKREMEEERDKRKELERALWFLFTWVLILS